jgi:AcrR family transcriptional regulator
MSNYSLFEHLLKGNVMGEIQGKTGGRGREGRRQRRIARRRREILAAAARVFASKGFAKATTREIADEADVAEGTLYNYFGGKREMLLSMAREMETPLDETMIAVSGQDDRTAAVALFEAAFDFTETQVPLLRALFSEALVDDDLLEQFFTVRLTRIEEGLHAYIAERISAGAFRPFDPALGARAVMGLYLGLMLPVIRGVAPLPSPEERRALAEDVTDLLLHGILAHEAQDPKGF